MFCGAVDLGDTLTKMVSSKESKTGRPGKTHNVDATTLSISFLDGSYHGSYYAARPSPPLAILNTSLDDRGRDTMVSNTRP